MNAELAEHAEKSQHFFSAASAASALNVKFVQAGGTLVTEGSTATIFPEYGITNGVTVETPSQLFVRGSILRAKITDKNSPIAYGYDNADLPMYFNQAPVLNAEVGG